jgi:hypothetical protein
VTVGEGWCTSVSSPPENIVRQLLGSEGLFCANQTDISVTVASIEIPFAHRKHRTFEVVEPTRRLTFHVASQSWAVE